MVVLIDKIESYLQNGVKNLPFWFNTRSDFKKQATGSTIIDINQQSAS